MSEVSSSCDTNHCLLKSRGSATLPGCRSARERFKSRSGKLVSIQNSETRQFQIWRCDSMGLGRASTRQYRSGGEIKVLRLPEVFCNKHQPDITIKNAKIDGNFCR